jgi:enoyl-CoA hydratase
VVACEGVTFAVPEAALGIVPAYALLRLHQIVGRHKAAELMMTCESISAEEALRLGLVNQVVPRDRLIDAAYDLALRLSKQPALSIEVIKSAIYKGLGSADYSYMIDAVSQFFATEELSKRIGAFQNKSHSRARSQNIAANTAGPSRVVTEKER